MNRTKSAIIYGKGLAQIEISEEYDSHFDGGEFSGPAHDRIRSRQLRLLVNRARHAGSLSRSAFNRMRRTPRFWVWIDMARDAEWEKFA